MLQQIRNNVLHLLTVYTCALICCRRIFFALYFNASDQSYEENLWYLHVVVEILGFGTMCICRSIPTFQRNMLSPSSGAEVTGQGSRWLI
jgi:hypothetical protein